MPKKQSKKLEKKCLNCDQIFYPRKDRYDKIKFCCQPCLYEYMRKDKVEITCLECGKKMFVKKTLATKKKYCSKACMAKHYKKTMTGRNNPHYKNGLTDKKNIYTWYCYNNMNSRCSNINNKNYYRYGGRGIAVCNIWKKDIQLFMKWADEHGYKDGLTIDRINNNGPYGPWNCQVISRKNNSKKMYEQKYRYLPV